MKALTDERSIDAAWLETSINQVVADRLGLARGLLRAAALLVQADDPIVRRSAVSRAYYAAYHAARAVVFAVRRRDEDDHEKLPLALTDVLGPLERTPEVLKTLRKLRNEMDYSPYPGPDPQSEYENGELDGVVKSSVEQAAALVNSLQQYLEQRG